MTRLATRFLAGLFTAVLCASLMTGCGGNKSSESEIPTELPALRAQLGTNHVALGAVVPGTIDVYHGLDQTIVFPTDLFSGDPDLELRSRKETVEQLSDTMKRSQLAFTVSSWRLGDLSVSTGRVTCVSTNGSEAFLPVKDLTLKVRSRLSNQEAAILPPSDETNTADQASLEMIQTHLKQSLQGARKAPALPPKPIPWGLILSGIFFVLSAGYLLKTLLNIKPILEFAPEPPHAIAIQRLRALQQKGYHSSGQCEPFYVDCSNILREYLEGRFAIRAPESTTEEFLQEAATHHALSSKHKSRMANFLQLSDLVKFAKHQPEASDMTRGFNLVLQIVEETAVDPNQLVADSVEHSVASVDPASAPSASSPSTSSPSTSSPSTSLPSAEGGNTDV